MFKKLLQEKGIQITKQRIALLDTLKKIGKPVTIDTLKKNLSDAMNTTTLYRSLSVLVEKGLVYQTDFRKGVAYYEYQGEQRHHHHLICTSCNEAQEISFCPSAALKKIAREHQFFMTSHSFEIFGVCINCQK